MKEKPNIVIIDYDCGNLFSLQRALTELSVSSVISRDRAEIRKADKLILPGVGAYGLGMDNIRDFGLLEVLNEFAKSGKPVLGICLGMQLLLNESFEFGHHQGLGWIPGKVTRLQNEQPGESPVKVPHIGWSPIQFGEETDECSPFRGLKNGTYMYFLHSYFVSTDQAEYCIGTTVYGVNKFCSVCQRDNILGVQFHPEISGPSGLQLLKNFVFELKKEGEVYANV